MVRRWDLYRDAIGTLLGHSDSASTERYTHIAPSATTARVEVTVAAGAYVLARPETQHVLLGFQSGLTRRRPALDVDEGSLLGNPGSGPIKVGDPVILEDSLAEYVASITEP